MILLLLFWEFFKVGLFTFGGGLAMIPLIKDVVISYGWVSESAFYDFIGICESTPGPIAVNMATYVGATQAGPLGSVCATLGVVMPSFIIILLIASILKNLTNNRFFKGFMRGVRPVVVALILATGVGVFLQTMGFGDIKAIAFNPISATAFALLCALYFGCKRILKRKLSTITLILFSAVLGIVVSLCFGAI